jgi:hypothetical protein
VIPRDHSPWSPSRPALRNRHGGRGRTHARCTRGQVNTLRGRAPRVR